MISVKDGAISVTPQADTDPAAIATMTSSTSDFLAWSTTRLLWRAMVSIEGDGTAAAEFLDAHNLI